MAMRTTAVPPVLLTLLLRGLSVCAAQAPAEFTPPGPNIALHKPYTMDPLPTYGDCADAADRTQLTDGEYTRGYLWVQPASSEPRCGTWWRFPTSVEPRCPCPTTRTGM